MDKTQLKVPVNIYGLLVPLALSIVEGTCEKGNLNIISQAQHDMKIYCAN